MRLYGNRQENANARAFQMRVWGHRGFVARLDGYKPDDQEDGRNYNRVRRTGDYVFVHNLEDAWFVGHWGYYTITNLDYLQTKDDVEYLTGRVYCRVKPCQSDT